jgi:hypothetical protein
LFRQHKRAALAARCVGWYAVTSAVRDDGHWSGYQLRRTDGDADPLHWLAHPFSEQDRRETMLPVQRVVVSGHG